MPDGVLDELARNGWLSRRLPREAETRPAGPLSGLRYVAKDLFDVAGLPTVAGSPSNLNNQPAAADAQVVRVLKGAGAQLMGLSNMDPLAYGFVTNNPLYGPACNPHDKARICGGSSGGSAGAVASGLVDFALGTDTSGSVRVPAAFTGIFGLKPTQGLFSAQGAAPLSPTLDRVGLFARDARTLESVAGVLSEGRLQKSAVGRTPKIAQLVGYFLEGLDPDISGAFDAAAHDLGAAESVTVSGAARARAAAYIIVASEAFQSHADALRTQLDSFDPATRARLIAAAAIPNAWLDAAYAFQATFTQRLEQAFSGYDFLLAPSVPCVAPLLHDVEAPGNTLRATLGRYTQPISLTGFPVLSLPISVPGTTLPTALQLIARPGGDADLLAFAARLPA